MQLTTSQKTSYMWILYDDTERVFYSYSKTIYSLGNKLEEYWNEIHHKRNKEHPNSIPVEDAVLVHRTS